MTQGNRQSRRPGKGAVTLIASLLIVSATIRLGTGTGDALAQATPDPETAALGNPASQDASSTDGSRVSEIAPQNRAELGSLLDALKKREKDVQERERQLEVRQKALEVADHEVRKRLSQLEQVEAELRQTLALADGAAEGDLARLTTVYENMKGKDAAALFEAMEPAFAAGFLGRMRPDAAANIMAGLTPEAAYSISVILAGRNANAPKS